MKWHLIILTLLIALFLVSAVSAEPSYVFKKDSNVDLKISCFDNQNNFCNNNTICQLNINYPNQSNLVSNGTMSFNNNFFNLTLDANQTKVSGEYSVIASCQGNLSAFSTFTYEINPTGIRAREERTQAVTRSTYIIFGIAVIFFLAFLFIGESAPIRWTFFILSMIFILVGINVIFVSLQDEVVNPNLENLFSFITAASFYLYWFAGGLLLIIWILTFLNTWFYKKNKKEFEKYGG